TGRQSAQLDTFNASLFDEGYWILKVVMRILSAVRCKDSSGRHGFAVDSLDNTQFVSANLNQRYFADDSFKREPDQMQTRFQHVRLNANFAFSCYYAAGRHLRAKITPFFDGDLSRTNVDHNALQDHKKHDQKNETEHKCGEQLKEIYLHDL